MAKISIHNSKGSIWVDVTGRGIVFEDIKPSDLKEGVVFGLSEGSEVLRMWVEGDKLLFLHLFSHDVAWPHHVYTFQLPVKKGAGENRPLSIIPLHEYLGMGHGVPAARS